MARLTPVITATSEFPFASRTALVRHEPPGRSTNRTAGLSPIARARRAARAPESHPSLLTATSASLTPVIAATADNSACATAACETITPRVGSLIVFLEILQHFAALGHAVEQPLVELPRGVDAAVAQQMVHRHDLADHRQVLAGVERHRDQGQRHVQEPGRLAVQAGAVVLARRVPVLQLDHNLDPLLLPHGPDPEQRPDVDQADAADLHVVPR